MDRHPKRIEWLQEWDHWGPFEKKGYVEREVARIQAAGEPLLYAALTLPLLDQIDMAIRAIRQVQSGAWLRLVDPFDATDDQRPHGVPPPLDPQGRELPKEDRGRVLVAKVGVRGQMGKEELEFADRSGSTRQFTGSARTGLAHTPQGLYRVARITRTPSFIPIEDAIVIMRQWGEGIRAEQFRISTHKVPQVDGTEKRVERLQDTWLVIEVPQRDGQMITPPTPERSQPKGQRAA